MTNVKRVVIVGSGSEAWLTAAALQVAFKHLKLDVCVVETQAARDVLGRWTLPSSRGIHGLLGIKEADFVRATNATFKLATEHCGWQGEGSRYLHAHGEIGSDLSGTPFYRYLAMQASMRGEADPEQYSLAAAAARRGRFARPIAKTALTSSFTYGYHLDDAAYRAYLQAHALKLGARRMESGLRDVVIASDGRIASVTLQGGASLEGDYFLDCSGRDAVLMQALSNTARDDWSTWLPNDRISSIAAPEIADAPALTRTIASDAGWCWQMPLASGSVAGIAYSSAFISDDEALDRLRATIPGVTGEPAMRTLASGRRQQLWYRNCIAVGASGVEHVLEIATRPVLATHSSARALRDHHRNLTDEQLRGIAATGGVICVNFLAGFLTEDPAEAEIGHLVDHIEHIAEVAGIDHVGLGPDFVHEVFSELVPPWCEDLAAMAEFDVRATIPGLEGPRGMPLVTRALVERGMAKEDIRKVLGGNVMRVFRAELGRPGL